MYRHALAAIGLSFGMALAACAPGSVGAGGRDSGMNNNPPDARVTPMPDAGTMVTPGAVGPSGGTVSLLKFAVYGDVRPSCLDATSSYPTSIIASIMQGIQAQGAQFTIATGDYMFADNMGDASAQVADLLSAEADYKGFVAHTMGNHECNGYTSSNCPNGSETPNVQVFMSKLVPFASKPYFSFLVHTSMGDAKFIQVAANAWDSTEQSWLAAQLAMPSTYTFVARHEPTTGSGPNAPGEKESQSLMDAASPPVTLELFGHSHEYSHYSGSNQVISGNGGAPLSGYSSSSYGYLMVVQRPDGNIAVTEYKQGTNSPTDTWAVTPAGAPTT